MIVKKSVIDKGSQYNEDRKLKQGYVDLKKQTIEELTELIDRQNKLLRNRAFIEKLPDKGKKINLFRDELQNELKKRQSEYDSACHLLAGLTLCDSKSEDIEWSQVKPENCGSNQLDSDDEDDFSDCESDPLKIIASHSGTCNSVGKKINFVQAAKVENKCEYVDKMCKKFDSTLSPKERFKPNQLKEGNKAWADSSTERLKKRLGNKWEITEATPPVFTIKNTKSITLAESIELQKQHAQKLRETEEKHAAEKLLLNMNIKMGEKLPVKNIDKYRNNCYEKSEQEDDDVEENEDNDSES
ncbi:hypothetical protein RUM43_010941 [Polyplax serrata]|uniref:Uncharacterized protein n=1 Tax=Polyplax serrata TaxID=468196 RepID=A0AAN8P5S7_POLSC